MSPEKGNTAVIGQHKESTHSMLGKGSGNIMEATSVGEVQKCRACMVCHSFSLTKLNNVQFFANLGKIYTIGRYDNPREVNTLDIRTGERSTACPRAEGHTHISAGVVRGKIFTCGGDRDICEL